jgi:hypothetical protein
LRVCPVTAIVGGQTRDAGKPEAFRGLILATLFGCRAYRLYSAKVVNGDFEPGFTMNLGLKNLGLAAAASQTLGRTPSCSCEYPRFLASATAGWCGPCGGGADGRAGGLAGAGGGPAGRPGPRGGLEC